MMMRIAATLPIAPPAKAATVPVFDLLPRGVGDTVVVDDALKDALEGALEEDALEGVLEEDALEGVLEEDALEGVLEEDALEGVLEEDTPEGALEKGAPEEVAPEDTLGGALEEGALEGALDEDIEVETSGGPSSGESIEKMLSETVTSGKRKDRGDGAHHPRHTKCWGSKCSRSGVCCDYGATEGKLGNEL
jgi:hypothetical protein